MVGNTSLMTISSLKIIAQEFPSEMRACSDYPLQHLLLELRCCAALREIRLLVSE
jgi:hypothetical protein